MDFLSVGRALIDMALAAGDDSLLRYYSVSAQIFNERSGYYCALGEAQRGRMDVTPWPPGSSAVF